MSVKISIPQQSLQDFCRRHKIRQLSLFGSVLRDDFRPDRDLDVLVELEPEARVGMFALTDMQDELAGIFKRRVDLVPKIGLKQVIRNSVLNSAQVIYAS
jgi:uncharacterized protein